MRSSVRAALAAVVIGAGCIAIPAPAGAATTWTRVNSPNAGPALNQLRGVSCVTPTSCTAVGVFGPKTTPAALILRTTDGVHWQRARGIGHVPGAISEGLQAVSCTSATDCTAVGGSSIRKTSTSRALILRTSDGVTWNRVLDARFGRVVSNLNGISCTSATQCTAVGNTEYTSIIVRTDDGVVWTRQRSPNPGRAATTLNGVSCTSAQSCVAVGDFTQDTSQGPTRTLVLSSTDGETWARTRTTNPNAAGVNSLAGVSCTGAFCVAVGYSHPPLGSKRPFLLSTTDGTTWERAVTPSGTSAVRLLGVSCVAMTTTCAASGFAVSADLQTESTYMLQTTDGSSWSQHPSPTPGITATPWAVSCAAADQCIAAGQWDGIRPGPGIQTRTLVLQEG